MRISSIFLPAMALLASGPLAAAETLHPVKMSRAQASGLLFEQQEPVVESAGGHTTWDVEQFITQERDLDMGLWRSEGFTTEYTQPWPYNEYIHLTDGSLTLTSSDGMVTQLQTGDSAMIPMGWTGTWDTPGMTKIYVIHAPNKDL